MPALVCVSGLSIQTKYIPRLSVHTWKNSLKITTMQTANKMNYLIKDKKLELKYEPGKGSWTYHLQIPNTKNIKGKWGDIKVSGSIDDYKFESKNLAPTKGKDKLLAVNGATRKAISKSGGDKVTVTLFLLTNKEQVNKKQILETFNESGVLKTFRQLSKEEQKLIIEDLLAQSPEEKQIQKIVSYLEQLNKAAGKNN